MQENNVSFESKRVESVQVDVQLFEGEVIEDDEAFLENRIAVLVRQQIALCLSDGARLPKVKSIRVHYLLEDD